MKKSWLIAGISTFITLVCICIAIYYFSPAQKLQRHGYSATESTEIIQKVNPDDLKIILEYEYQPEFVNLIHDPNFNSIKTKIYLETLEKSKLSAVETIALIEHSDFDPGKIYTSAMLQIMQEPYYLSSRAERYFALLNTSENTDYSNLVAMVNADRDYDFYTETQPARTDLGKLMLVNKYYFLDENYTPDLVEMSASYGTPGILVEREAYDNFQNLYAAALAEGIQYYVTSGYRDYYDQTEVFDSWVTEVGAELAPNYAALPGFSEHQTGYALDVFVPGFTTTNFAGTPAANWLAIHAPEFGFILRYPEDKVALTGYDYEAWHLRFVGQEAAKAITNQNLTFEEYYATITEQIIE